MGKRGSRNRNTNLKKKPIVNPENNKLSNSILQAKPTKSDSKSSDTNEFEMSIRKILKSLMSTFRSRLISSNEPYAIDISVLSETKCLNLDLVLSRLANELTEDILSQVQNYLGKLSVFLLESYACFESVCTLFEKISESKSSADISKLIFYCKVLKPAWEVDKSLSKTFELKNIYCELQELLSNCKDFSLLPLNHAIHFLQGKKSNKIFKRLFSDSSTDESSSPNRSVDCEVEEFQIRLESCEKPATRRKPQVSEEWLNTLKRQLNKIRF
ncbi:hypothetical protein SteCoe_15878 [Stentor coeruleus]|uniref:Uncharacterized protein n=1 Tax=Stentor coeruleus TaxID=5963 RepID=A0A1R2C2K4_9CILI|nr:hypothetical protein SteCoe_15878 [Stentor coeruleus]